MGWELAQVYEDVGPATRQGDLRGLQAAVAQADDLDRLVVVRLDRIGASARRALNVLTRLQDAGCELVSVDQRFDTGQESGRAVRGLLEGLTSIPPGPIPKAGAWTPDLVQRHGAHPATVVDVGAGAGTPALYSAFPDAYHVLIEPLREFDARLQSLLEECRGEHIQTAIGAEQGEVVLNVSGSLYTTSALRPKGLAAKGTPRRVSLTTLDALLQEREWAPPYCLKVDVEGYEHAVIEGARQLLEDTELVIAEVSVTPRFDGALTGAELIALMAYRGFEVVDVIDAANTRLGLHADLVFKPRAARERAR